jgi:nicotinate-nucleotide adenylyltransferase
MDPPMASPGQPIGIFGGTFDPVHFGHLRAASEAREALELEDFRLLPAGSPPHREGVRASAEDRLRMLRLAVTGHDDLRIDDREVRREGPSYMVDTLGEIRQETPGAPIVLILGHDAAARLDSWHRWRALFDLAHIAIMTRPGAGPAPSAVLASEIEARQVPTAGDLWSTAAGKVLPLPVTRLAISATDIRAQISSGRNPRFLLPRSVIEYVGRKGLYLDADQAAASPPSGNGD